MALVDLFSRAQWPDQETTFFNQGIGSQTDINAAAERIAWHFIAPQAGQIEQFHVQIGTLTTAQNVHFSIQDADSDFKPDGTEDEFVVLASGSMSANTMTATGPITSDGTGGGTRRTVSKGDKLTLVAKFDSTVGDVDFVTGNGQGHSGLIPNTSVSVNSGSTWTFQDRYPNMAIEYVTDGIVYTHNCYPLEAVTASSASFNTGTTPDEMAMKFQVPFTGRCVGAYFVGNNTDTIQYSIETAAKSVVAGPDTVLLDAGTTSQRRFVQWSTPVTLTIDTDYYLIWEPSTVTSKNHRYFTLSSAAMRAALPSGIVSSYNTRTDNGAWSEDTTKWSPFSLVFDQLDDGAGGGGGSCALVNGTAVIPATCPV
jgi:hypothetical protein